MMKKHMHLHPLIPYDEEFVFLTAETIWSICFREMIEFCGANNLNALLVYLYNKWYRPNMWSLWSRASHPSIPLGRTNMFCEFHFRFLKHDVLCSHRPRLDHLVWIIMSKVTAHFQDKLAQRHLDRSPPGW